MPACSQNLVADINQLEGMQRLGTRLVTGIRHLPCEERLLSLGLHFLQWRRLRADLITAFKIFTSLLDIDPNLFFPPTRRGIRGHNLQCTQRYEPPPKEMVGLFDGGCEILELAPGFRRYSSFCQHFQEEVQGILDRVFPHWLNTHLPIPLLPPPAHHPVTVPISICYPTPSFVYVISLDRLWSTFTHYKS